MGDNELVYWNPELRLKPLKENQSLKGIGVIQRITPESYSSMNTPQDLIKLKGNNMNDNFEELDQRFLEITRDLTNSLGHELLTDELIVVKEHFFNLIHQYYRISDFLIEKTRRELEEVIESNPKLKKMIEDSLQGTKWID